MVRLKQLSVQVPQTEARAWIFTGDDEWSPHSSFETSVFLRPLGLLQRLVVFLQHGPSLRRHEAVRGILPLAGHLPHTCAWDEIVILMAEEKENAFLSDRRFFFLTNEKMLIASTGNTGRLAFLQVQSKDQKQDEAHPTSDRRTRYSGWARILTPRPVKWDVTALFWHFWQLIQIFQITLRLERHCDNPVGTTLQWWLQSV